MGVETLESCAQILTALCSLGIDPETDERFVKGGCWTVENLLSYHIPGSGFMHVKPGAGNNGGGAAGELDGLATGQGFYALTAYKRLKEGKTALYDMSDLNVTPGGKGDGSGTGLETPEPTRLPTGTPAEKAPTGEETPSGGGTSDGNSQAIAGTGTSVPASGTGLYGGSQAPAAAGQAASGSGAAGSLSQNTVSSGNGKEPGSGGWDFEGEAYIQEGGGWDFEAEQEQAAADTLEAADAGVPFLAWGTAGGLLGTAFFELILALARKYRKDRTAKGSVA